MQRLNLYNWLQNEFSSFDTLIDVGCKGLHDLIDFEDSKFKKLIGISREFQRNTAFGDYRLRKTENLPLTDEEWREYSDELIQIFMTRYDIKEMDFFDFKFEKNTYSFIICNKVLHFYNDDVKLQLIDTFYDSLQSGGLLFLKLNHQYYWDNIDPAKTIRIGENVYQNKEVETDIRYLVNPVLFKEELSRKYSLLSNFTQTDDNTFTTVLRKG